MNANGTELNRLSERIIGCAFAVVNTLGAGFLAWRDWDRVGRGVEDEAATIDSRSRFLALGGMAISALSALLILAQWLAIFVFGACMRA